MGEVDPLESVRAAREAQNQAEALTAAAVQQAREAGRTWQEIGDALGVSPDTFPLPEADELASAVIDDLAHARWTNVSARFDATMRDGLTEEELAKAWAHISGLVGDYQGHGDVQAVRAGDLTTTNTPLSFETGDFVARVTFRGDRTIAGLYILNPEAAEAH